MRLALATVIAFGGCKFSPGATGNPPGDGAAGDALAADATDAADAGSHDSRSIDAPAEPCLARWLDGSIRFDAPVLLDTLNSPQSDRDAFLTSDELTIYFSSERNAVNNGDVFTSTRASVTAAFPAPSMFVAATTPGYDSKLAMTDDELLFVVANDQTGTKGGPDIWQSARSATSNGWNTLDESHEGTLDTAVSELDPAMTPDGLHIYLSVGTGIQHIGLSTRPSRSMDFSAPTTITAIDNSVGEADPAISADERILLFTSGRTGAGHAGQNLWYAVRADPTQAFGAPQPVPDVNTDADEGDAFLSRDGCHLYFDEDSNGFPDYQLRVATAK